jgi:hypothetical protein
MMRFEPSILSLGLAQWAIFGLGPWIVLVMPGFLDWDQWWCAHAVFVRLLFIEANKHGERYRATSSLIETCRALSRIKPARENEMLAEMLDSFATLTSCLLLNADDMDYAAHFNLTYPAPTYLVVYPPAFIQARSCSPSRDAR